MNALHMAPPLLGAPAGGAANIQFILVRGATGDVTSAVVAFDVSFRFPNEQFVTAVEICEAAAGETGAVAIDAGITRALRIRRNGKFIRQLEITDPTGIATVEAIIANPAGYYVIVLTKERPSGAMRGQLESTTQVLDAIAALDAKLDGIKAETDKIAGLEAKLDELETLLRQMARTMGLVLD